MKTSAAAAVIGSWASSFFTFWRSATVNCSTVSSGCAPRGGRVVPTLNGHRHEVLEVVRDVHWDARRGLPNDPPRRFGVRSRRRGAKVGDRVNPLEAPDVVPPVAVRAVSHHVLLRVVDLVGGALRRAAALGAFL